MQRRFVVGLAVAVIMVAGACSKDSTTPAASPASQESAATSTEAPTTGVAAYTAYEMGFDGPDTLPAGISDITMENVGTVNHMMFIVRLDKNQDWTEEQVVAFVKNDPQAQPKWAPSIGGVEEPVAPGETGTVQFMDFSSGGQPTVIKDGSLEPGTYLFMCFLGSKQQPHAAMGMVKKVTVT